ncbi:ubiquitin carboxyl-terminal hydrolase 29-like isoform X2 [Takifugu flavidus]|uniref:ubiquitin carboxyl-terminal hydrolase 29-like isoform X2 n=1 Tax=Takifugu flavidus TaxID=433684 RepID=UPI00254410DF|nr:ubiquitin carboxyl-terminal hydrolase 29-like isoform X2 [Takifugu flavidus]
MTLFNRPFPSALKKNQEKIQEPEEIKAVPRNILCKAQKDNNSILRKVTFSEERSTRSEEIGHKFPRAETTPAKTFSTVQSFGLPNIGQTCYMNSSLQSLLILTDFMNDISSLEKDWRHVPGAKMLKELLKLRKSHTSTDQKAKVKLLLSFKLAVSMNAPAFMGNLQHDAHEFLTTVLDQISMAMRAASEQSLQSIVCPVKKHMDFCVNSVRKCKSCNIKSVRKLQYTNLSLDVIPGATVEEMMQRYFTEEEVLFKCEWCEGCRSVLSSSLESLPRVFILQLKRFCFFTNSKISDPVKLQRDIIVRSAQGAACYSLVSVISHLGTLHRGHYVCDCIYPDRSSDDFSDPWMMLNDATVYPTNGAEVCEQRSRLGYILFYKRNDVDVRNDFE